MLPATTGTPARPLSAATEGYLAEGVPPMGIELPVIWFVIIVFATLMYIVSGWL